MNHVQQPEGSNLCGHACLAMVLGIDLEAAKARLGHGRRTRTRELVAALGEHAEGARLRPLKKDTELPDFALLKVTWAPNQGHFVVYAAPLVFDPSLPGSVTFKPYYQWWVDSHKGRVTSFLALRRVLPDPR